jgi:Fe-S cluster assembly protein SufD
MGAIAMMKTPAETGLAETFEAVKLKLPGNRQAREQAFGLFAERGLPHRRVEEFKYTDLRAAMRDAAPLADRASVEEAKAAVASPGPFGPLDGVVVTIVNGYVVPEASRLDGLPEGVEITALSKALAAGDPLFQRMKPVPAALDNPIYQLNAAFMTDGAVIRIAANTAVERPIHLRFVTTGNAPAASATRTLVAVEEAASVTLIESHEGPQGVASQLNDVVEFAVADRAKVRHVRLNAEGREALALSTLTAHIGQSVSFDTLNVVVGAGVSRHQVFMVLAGERSLANINGATMINGRQHADTTLVVNHAAVHCTSRELFKTVIDGDATGVFQGKIIVEPHAQKTDGRMMSASLLLSEGGAMNNKPELEIFADDVQCGHGATSGQLDEDLLFYIMARGISKAEAESLLIQAFLGEAIETVADEGIHDALVGLVEGWLRARG